MTALADQRHLALERANAVRSAQANIKENVSVLSSDDGKRLVANLLAEPTPAVGSMRVGSLLKSIRRVGQVKMVASVAAAGIRSAERRVGDLTPNQRMMLMAWLLRDVRSA